METKINRLEVSVEVNTGYGNDTTLSLSTLPVSQNTETITRPVAAKGKTILPRSEKTADRANASFR